MEYTYLLIIYNYKKRYMNRTHMINVSNKEETPDKIGIVSREG